MGKGKQVAKLVGYMCTMQDIDRIADPEHRRAVQRQAICSRKDACVCPLHPSEVDPESRHPSGRRYIESAGRFANEPPDEVPQSWRFSPEAGGPFEPNAAFGTDIYGGPMHRGLPTGHVRLNALRNIQKGEEVTVCYGNNYDREHRYKMPACCRARGEGGARAGAVRAKVRRRARRRIKRAPGHRAR